MPHEKDNRTYYERLKRRLYDNRLIAWLVLVAVVSLAVINYYNEFRAALDRAWKATGTVEFTSHHAPLIERGTVEIRQDSRAVHVVDFNAPVSIEIGPYNAAAHIDNRVLLHQAFQVSTTKSKIVFDAKFAVKGIVVNGQGHPLANVIVTIDDRSSRTKNDGVFVLDNLPMQRTYDIRAYAERGGAFTSRRPWMGTVYNGNWDLTVTQNIALAR